MFLVNYNLSSTNFCKPGEFSIYDKTQHGGKDNFATCYISTVIYPYNIQNQNFSVAFF